jgi:hypothetical protein
VLGYRSSDNFAGNLGPVLRESGAKAAPDADADAAGATTEHERRFQETLDIDGHDRT